MRRRPRWYINRHGPIPATPHKHPRTPSAANPRTGGPPTVASIRPHRQPWGSAISRTNIICLLRTAERIHMTEFEDRVSAVLTELRSHSAIDVEMFEERSLATWLTGPEHALDMVRNAAGVDFDPAIGRNFHRFDGLGCAWSSTEEPSISGEFWLTNLVYVCVSRIPED